MHAHARRVGLAVGLLIGAVLPAFAKPPIEKVIISGPELAAPVEVTKEEVLTLSNPWGGRFIDWSSRISPAPQGTPVYDVTLLARLRASPLKPIYLFRYAPGADGKRGQVYLPGAGEPWYRQNVSVILREGDDGRWHAASPGWDAEMKAALHLTR